MAEEPDEGFPPVPALTEPVDADEELRLEDALADAPVVTELAPPPPPLGRAPAFDFTVGRLIPGAAGGPLMTRGDETLRGWIEKCIHTRRGENPAVDPDFGLDFTAEDLLEEGRPFDPAAVSEYVSAIERALLVHPRVTAVQDVRIDADPDDDAVLVSITVATVGDDVDEAPELTFGGLRVTG